jgi:hypothetical protein
VELEYMIMESRLFERKVRALEEEMNRLGSGGWEMIAACGVHNQTFVFTRQIRAATKPRAKPSRASA